MADGLVQVAPDSTGKKIDATELTVGANTVERQRVQIAGNAAADLAGVGDPNTDADAATLSLAVEAFLKVYNGTTWDRARGSIANGLLADVSRLQDLVVTGQATGTLGNNAILAAAGAGGFDAAGFRSFTCQVVAVGTVSSGAVIFECSNDGNAWTSVLVHPVGNTVSQIGNTAITAPTTGASIHYEGKTCGRYFRCRISTVIGGGGTIQAITLFKPTDFTSRVSAISDYSSSIKIANGAGTAIFDAAARRGYVQLTDGTSTQAVKAASTIAAAADPAAVVSLSPNSPVPATTSLTQACLTGLATALTVANIKASAGNVFGVSIVNKTAGIIYIQFYNTAGTPTLGTSVIWWIPVPASGTVFIPPATLAMANHATGIGIGASTTPTSTGTPGTAPDVVVFYK